MKTTIITTILWIQVLAVIALDDTPKPALGEVIKDWKTVRISLDLIEGDYADPSPYILLQRLDGNRAFVSSAPAPLIKSESLPEARALISNVDAQKLIDRMLAFWKRAQTEIDEVDRLNALPQAEREAILKVHVLEFVGRTIRIQVLNQKGEYEYKHELTVGGATAREFEAFLRNLMIESK